MRLIVGLGNPGKQYEKTKHNMGFEAIDAIAKFLKIEINHYKDQGLYIETNFNHEKIILLKPQSYINLSGEVIAKYLNYYKIPIENLLVIHDDLDLDIGKIKLKYKGSSGGHNGLKNIEKHIHTQEYKRLKIGISNNKLYDTKEYVLTKFTKENQQKIEDIMQIIPHIFEDYMTSSFDNIMNKYNKK